MLTIQKWKQPKRPGMGAYMRHTLILTFIASGLITQVTLAAPYALSPDGNAVVRIIPQTSAPALNTSLITSQYPGWTVTTGATGSFANTTYDAGWQGSTGGAKFEGTYSQSSAVASGSQLNYVQIINTNVPLNGAVPPYIDPVPNDDNLPFYWTTGEASRYGSSRSIIFSDFSKRSPTSLTTTNPINWTANLYPAIYDGVQGLEIGSGVQWGWTMKPATVGNVTAIFDSPSPSCPPASCSGIGTNSISFGTGSPGSLSFSGTSFAPMIGDAFKLGTLSYTNGSTNSGTSIDDISLNFSLNFTNVPEVNFTYHTSLSITNTTNSDDPITSADYVRFTTGGFPATFNVLEGASASVDLMAKLSPAFALTPAIRSVSLSSGKEPFQNVDPPQVLGYNLELLGFTSPGDGGFVTNVPEPNTVYLLLTVMVLAGFIVRLRSNCSYNT